MEILVADIGGTHARFAIAEMRADQLFLSRRAKMQVSEHASFSEALELYLQEKADIKFDHAVVAIAAPIKKQKAQLTNAAWQFDAEHIRQDFSLKTMTLINDFVAVGHSVIAGRSRDLLHCFGPEISDHSNGPSLVVGPGTGLGVALIVANGSTARVIETEGGHIGFSPIGDFQLKLFEKFRSAFGRVSIERVTAGPALRTIWQCLQPDQECWIAARTDAQLWEAALRGNSLSPDSVLSRYCGLLGSAIGDLALASGAAQIILSGSIANRLKNHLSAEPLITGFHDKGRFRETMENISVQLFAEEEAGLLGAAGYFHNQRET